MSKRSNRHLRRAVTLAAQSASRTDPQCRASYGAQRTRGKHHTVALSHVAHQLLHIAYTSCCTSVRTRRHPTSRKRLTSRASKPGLDLQ